MVKGQIEIDDDIICTISDIFLISLPVKKGIHFLGFGII